MDEAVDVSALPGGSHSLTPRFSCTMVDTRNRPCIHGCGGNRLKRAAHRHILVLYVPGSDQSLCTEIGTNDQGSGRSGFLGGDTAAGEPAGRRQHSAPSKLLRCSFCEA
jgi:hypothetical protein